MASFTGKAALVTGAASGIGEATARLLGEAGAAVLVTDIDADGAARVAAALRQSGSKSTSCRLDVSVDEDWQATISAALERWGQIDVLVANAGVSLARPVDEMSLDEWRRVMAINLDGVFLGTKHAVQAMRKLGRPGSIVIVSSASGIKAAPGASAYAASKAALRLFAKSVALEVAAQGVRVNCIHPAGVESPMWRGTPFWDQLIAEHGDEAGAWRALAASTPMKRFARPEEIARAILFLASDDASYITGAELVVDGGFTA